MIQSLRIKNFKSIKETEVTFGNFNVLVGLNGAGKTNFIQALLFLKNLVGGLEIDDAAEDASISIGDLLCKKGLTKKIELGCTIRNGTETIYQLEIGLTQLIEARGMSFIVSSEKLFKCATGGKAAETVYERDQEAKVTLGDGSEVPLDVALDQLAIGIYLEPDAKTVKDIFRKVYIPDSTHVESRNPVARSSSRSLAGILLRLKHENPQDFENFKTLAKKLIPSFGNIVDLPARNIAKSNSEVEPPYLFLLEEEDLGDRLSMRALSLGDVRTLYIIAAALYRPENSTLVIEEIENGIHPARMIDLVDRLKTISRVKDMQIIFTTHSPALINRQDIQDILYVEKVDGVTNATAFRDAVNLTKIQDVLNEGGKLTDFIYERK